MDSQISFKNRETDAARTWRQNGWMLFLPVAIQIRGKEVGRAAEREGASLRVRRTAEKRLAWSRGTARRWLSVVIGALLLAGLPLAGAAAPAQAASGLQSTNFGCSDYHHVADIHLVPVYTGHFCAYVGQNPGGPFGQSSLTAGGALRYGGWFNAFSYRISGTPTACNFWVDLDMYSGGQRYFHSQGTEVKGCTSVIGSTYNRKFNADYILRPSSQVCATVWKWSGKNVIRHAGVCAVIS